MKWTQSSAIVIDITPTRVTFSDMEGAPVSLAPSVYVGADGDRDHLIAVGVDPPPGILAIRVDVFSTDAPSAGVSKFDCLVALFAQGLKTIVDRSIIRLKPEVLVRGAETLSAAFGGYQRDLLALALDRAGARRVRWPEEFVPE